MREKEREGNHDIKTENKNSERIARMGVFVGNIFLNIRWIHLSGILGCVHCGLTTKTKEDKNENQGIDLYQS